MEKRRHGRRGSPDGWGGVAAFTAEFCALGGSVKRIWTPPFAADAALLRQVPASADGVMVVARYGFAPLLRAYVARHADAARSLLLDLRLYAPDELAAYAESGPRLRGVVGHLAGLPDQASPSMPPTATAFANAFPGLPPQVADDFSVLPYYTAVDALVQSLEKTSGEAGKDRAQLRAALASLRLATPEGTVRLDRNRQAIVPATLDQFDGTATGRAVVPSGAPNRGSRRGARWAARAGRRSELREPWVPARDATALGALSSAPRRLDRPGEAGLVPGGREAAGTQAAAHQQRRAGLALHQRAARGADALGLPAAREADDHEAHAQRGGGQRTRIGSHQQRLRGHAHGALHRQRGIGEQAARVAPRPVARRTSEHERAVARRRQPGAELDRRPVVLGARERDQNGAIRRLADEHTDIASGAGENRHQVVVGQQSRRRLDEQEIGVLLLREAHDILAGVGGGEGGGARRDAVAQQRVTALVELPGRRAEPPGIVDEGCDEQLAPAARGERRSQPDERVEPPSPSCATMIERCERSAAPPRPAPRPRASPAPDRAARIARSSSCRRGPGSSPSSSASERRASRSTSSASTGRPRGRAPAPDARAAARAAGCSATSARNSPTSSAWWPHSSSASTRRSTACSRISSSRSASATSSPPSAMSASAGPRQSASASANDADASCGRPPRRARRRQDASCSKRSTSRPRALDAQHVGVAARLDRITAERAAQIRDVSLHDVARALRCGVAPHLVDQAADRDGAVRAYHEHREHGATARTAESDDTVAVAHLQRPENPVVVHVPSAPGRQA